MTVDYGWMLFTGLSSVMLPTRPLMIGNSIIQQSTVDHIKQVSTATHTTNVVTATSILRILTSHKAAADTDYTANVAPSNRLCATLPHLIMSRIR
jgi:hypothetical protein